MNQPADQATRPLMLPGVEAARFLGIPLSTLNLERRRGHIPAKRIGGGYWYSRQVLENYASTMDGDEQHEEKKIKRFRGTLLGKGS